MWYPHCELIDIRRINYLFLQREPAVYSKGCITATRNPNIHRSAAVAGNVPAKRRIHILNTKKYI